MDLEVAIVEAVKEVKAALGPDRVPTWVQLMVSGDYIDPAKAPAFVLECFTPAGPLAAPWPPPHPVLFGGVVHGCIGGRGQTMDGRSVSIMAVVMPGVEVIPFHTEDSSLPAQVTAWGKHRGKNTLRPATTPAPPRPAHMTRLHTSCARRLETGVVTLMPKPKTLNFIPGALNHKNLKL